MMRPVELQIETSLSVTLVCKLFKSVLDFIPGRHYRNCNSSSNVTNVCIIHPERGRLDPTGPHGNNYAKAVGLFNVL